MGDIFKFDFPIGWDELGAIFTSLGAIFTFFAVIVALFANHNSGKQLKKALQMHEQSKNTELFDQRVALLEDVKKNVTISYTKLRLLFDDKTVSALDEYTKSHNIVGNYKSEEEVYWYLFNIQYNRDPKRDYLKIELHKYANDFKKLNDKQKADFKSLCDSYTVYVPEDNGERKIINYFYIAENLPEALAADKANKEVLIKQMEQYISDSIKPLF